MRVKDLARELLEYRTLYNSVISRINKLEDDTRAEIEVGGLSEDNKAVEMILSFCDDITALIGE